MWRLDYIASENSKGFHASQEAARILAESIDRVPVALRGKLTPKSASTINRLGGLDVIDS
jgi:nitrite reductase (cytochrome c-552)